MAADHGVEMVRMERAYEPHQQIMAGEGSRLLEVEVGEAKPLLLQASLN